MLRQLGVVISVGLADSLNPSTVGPALVLAAGARRVRRVTEFTLGVWTVNLVAGLVLLVGPARLLLDLVPHPQRNVRHLIELIAGIVLIALAVITWASRRRLARRPLPMARAEGRSSAFVTGASLAAVELPTAAPYLAVVAGVAASTATAPEQILLVVLYNLAFVVPLLAILVALLVAGDRADPWLTRLGAWLQRRWPVVLAGLLMFVGGALATLGGLGLLGRR
ncbi:MAG: GAP family protein [Solirubrobacteraceae bacterium]